MSAHTKATALTISLRTLTDAVRDMERAQAPGSETILWGDYIERMRQVSGVLPIGDYDDAAVPRAEAMWWLGAYAAHEAYDQQAHSPYDSDGGLLIPRRFPASHAPSARHHIEEVTGDPATTPELDDYAEGWECAMANLLADLPDRERT